MSRLLDQIPQTAQTPRSRTLPAEGMIDFGPAPEQAPPGLNRSFLMPEESAPSHQARATGLPASLLPSLPFSRSLLPPGELPSDPVTLGADRELYRNWFSAKSLSTCRLYRRVVVGLLTQYPGRPLATLDAADVNAYLRPRKERLAPDSFATEASVLRALFRYGFKRGYLPRDLSWELFKGERMDRASCISRRLVSEDEARLMIRSGSSHRDQVLLCTLYITGCRASELSCARWSDLLQRPDGSGCIFVVGKRGKSRTLPLPPGEFQFLCSLKRPQALPSDPVFSTERDPKKPLSPGRIWERVKVAARRSGVTVEISPHWFRHMNAHHAMRNGASLPTIVKQHGHTDLRTAGHYLSALAEGSTSEFLNSGVAEGKMPPPKAPSPPRSGNIAPLGDDGGGDDSAPEVLDLGHDEPLGKDQSSYPDARPEGQ